MSELATLTNGGMLVKRRNVLEQADASLLLFFGFSLNEIVEISPKILIFDRQFKDSSDFRSMCSFCFFCVTYLRTSLKLVDMEVEFCRPSCGLD